MSVSDWCGSEVDWGLELEALKRRIAPVFGRKETHRSAGAFLDGLLSGIERKTGWLMAEQAGLERPYQMQSLLGRSSWSADQLRDDVCDYVMGALHDEEGVLVVDETGFVKKGTQSVGVSRQYSGTAGRVENCQIGVFVGYASRFGQALIDRQLYLPKVWAEDAARRTKVHVPEDIEFATKPAMARAMISRALDMIGPCAFVLADALYGSDYKFRKMLQDRGQPYVLAVRSNQDLRLLTQAGLVITDTGTLADAVPEEDWHCHTAGEGSKGPRLYEWSRVHLAWDCEAGFERWLLVRRSRKHPDKRAYYFAHVRTGTSLAEMAGAAGLRWTIEECFLRAKDDLGLDHCEARSWHGWHRHMTLVMAAAAFLAKLSADIRRAAFQTTDDSGKQNETSPLRPARV